MTRSRERPDDRRGASRRTAEGPQRPLGLHVGRVRITPLRVALAIALLGSGLFNLAALLLFRDERQIPMLSSGFGVMGIVFAALALGGAISTWRAGAIGRSGRALVLAILGGLAGIAAAGCLAAAVVLALLWGG